MASSDFTVRKLKEDEIQDFQEITWQNYIYVGQDSELLLFLRGKIPGELTCAVSATGRIIGTCCCVTLEKLAIICALSTVDEGEDPVEVCKRLVADACKPLLKYYMFIEIVISSSIPLHVDYNIISLITPNWQIRLYFADIDKIVASMKGDSEYKVFPIQRERYSISVNYTSSNEENKDISIKGPNRHTHFPYNLTLDGVTVGYGVLFKVDKDKWLIGPLIAHNEEGALYLFNYIFLEIRKKDISGQLFIYSLHENAGRILDKCGFIKSYKTWVKYSLFKHLLFTPRKMNVELASKYFAIDYLPLFPKV